ncbi:MAG: type II secretion system major pseudopilin GspG [Bacteriovoracaceae bacterium]|jgi:general secretion pathway protein G|nr:type II secretion system major pseudopilin GspG [Bacteriovoracaceae bacterium]
MFKREMKTVLKSQHGMSLIEILIAITLLGVVGTLVVSNVIDSLREGETNSTKIQIKSLGKILLDYKRKCGAFPTTDQGLDALVQAPTSGRECKRYPPNGFIQDGKIPQDPWGYEFEYTSDGRTYTIRSFGVDGLEGGEGWDADISSEDL